MSLFRDLAGQCVRRLFPRGLSCCSVQRVASGAPEGCSLEQSSLTSSLVSLSVRLPDSARTTSTCSPGLVAVRFVLLFPATHACSTVGFSTSVASVQVYSWPQRALLSLPTSCARRQAPRRRGSAGSQGPTDSAHPPARFPFTVNVPVELCHAPFKSSWLTRGSLETCFNGLALPLGKVSAPRLLSWGQKCRFSGTPRFIRRVLGWEERNWHPDSLHSPCLR